jgi:hypothetical protein
MEAPALPEGNALSRAARSYHGWHAAKPIRPRGWRFIYRILFGGVAVVILGLVLAGVAIAYSADIEAEYQPQLLTIGTSLVFIGISTFAMGYAYRLRGADATVSQERRAELASILIFSEAAGFVGILIGLWSGAAF